MNDIIKIIFWTLKLKNTQLCKYCIIKYQIDVNCTMEGKPLLIQACESNNLDIITFLIDRNVDINVIFKNNSLIQYCIKNCNTTLLLKLMQNNLIYTRFKYEILLLACKQDDILIVKFLLDNQVDNQIDINYTDETYGYSIIMYACGSKSYNVIMTLLSYDIDISIQDKYGNTVFLYACLLNDDTIIKTLLTRNIDLSIINNAKMNALMYICYNNNSVMFDLVFEYILKLNNKNEIINQQNIDRNTALVYACNKDNNEIMTKLIQNGAKKDIKIEDGITISMYISIYSDYVSNNIS